MSDLEWKKLSEVVELVIDNRGRNPKSYATEGIPVIDNYLITSDGEANLGEVNRYIDEETYNSFLRKYVVEGDVLMTLVGNGYGKVATTPREKCAIIQNTIGLRCNKDNSNLFLYYLLRNNRESLMNLNRGAAQPSIKVGDVLNLEFGFPTIDKQNRIASVLGAIDKKIQLNRQISQTLEQIAQAIFKSWFVDFEPVKAKIEAKQNGQDPERAAMRTISGKTDEELEQLNHEQLQQLTATAALFPDELIDSELGEIPKGWKAGKLGDLYSAKGGYAYKSKDFITEGNPVVKIKNITGSGTVDLNDVQYINDDLATKSSRFELHDGDLVMAMTGATVGKTGIIVNYTDSSPYLNQRVAKFESAYKTNQPSWFVFCLFKMQTKFDELVGNASGSAQPNISSTGIEGTSMVVATNDLVVMFNETVDSLFQKWVLNIKENTSLSSIRDSLLPKLLSGEFTISDTQSTVEAVA